ncbi:MAG: hypothetical protein KUG77_17165 [Nannocystaceae bacterium]|nr:hypothetical protein [Nannocystaceae bacterium]
MVGIVEAHHPLWPVDELAPLSVSVTPSDCPMVFDSDEFCPEPGWTQTTDVTIDVPGGSVTVTGAGESGAPNHRVYVDHAFIGQFDTCGADQGDPNGIALMVVRAFAIK